MYAPTKDELLAFLRKVEGIDAPENYHLNEETIGSAIKESGLAANLTVLYNTIYDRYGYGKEMIASVLMSAWATGFQMGREFETDRVGAEELKKIERMG